MGISSMERIIISNDKVCDRFKHTDTDIDTTEKNDIRHDRCTKCNGNMFYDCIDVEWYCLQCGHRVR